MRTRKSGEFKRTLSLAALLCPMPNLDETSWESTKTEPFLVLELGDTSMNLGSIMGWQTHTAGVTQR